MSKLYPTQDHPSFYGKQLIVYPVVSRRSGGVSIGINLSPSKACSFACIYCQVQVQRNKEKGFLAQISPETDLASLESELRSTVQIVADGSLFQESRFFETPPEKRILRDFAFSGDGEPTLSPQFAEAADITARLRKELALDAVKLVLITNATALTRPGAVAGCDILAANNGEIWAKLDAGTEDVYRRMNRSEVPFSTVLQNIEFAAKRWPVKIQTMFLASGGVRPAESEIDAYTSAIGRILQNGGRLLGVQLYTVARKPVDSSVSALTNDEMDELAFKVRQKTGLTTEVFYSR